MPAAFARSASSFPAELACSSGLSVRRSGSVHWTEASVTPASSSMSWANTPRLERNTEIRGRSAEPCTFARTRRRRRRRLVGGDRTVMPRSACWPGPRRTLYSERWSLRPLPDLPGDVLALVADALALVGLRRALLADVRGDLADELLGDPLHDDARRLRDLELDALGRRDVHGVRVAQREREVLAGQRRAVADALDLQGLRVAVGDALDHVEDQRARQPVQGAVLAAVGRALDEELALALLDGDVAALALGQRASRAGHVDDLGLDRHGDAVGHGDGLLADAAHDALTTPRRRPRRPRRRAAPRG